MDSLSLGPRTLGELIFDPFRIFGRNAVPVLVIGVAPGVLITLVLHQVDWPHAAIAREPAALSDLLDAAFFTTLALLLLGGVLVYPLVSGALTWALSQGLRGQRLEIGRAYRATWTRLGALIGVHLLMTWRVLLLVLGFGGVGYSLGQATESDVGRFLGLSGLILGFLALLVYLLIRWALVTPAIMVEGLGPRAALARSACLVRPCQGRVLGLLLVWGLLTAVLAQLLGRIPGVERVGGTELVGPLYILALALLYFDLRVRQEGYTMDDLAAELNHEDHPWKGA